MYYYSERPLVRARSYEVMIKRLHDLVDHVDLQEKMLVQSAIGALSEAIRLAEETARARAPKPAPVAPRLRIARGADGGPPAGPGGASPRPRGPRGTRGSL
jgi:hypothetical protein